MVKRLSEADGDLRSPEVDDDLQEAEGKRKAAPRAVVPAEERKLRRVNDCFMVGCILISLLSEDGADAESLHCFNGYEREALTAASRPKEGKSIRRGASY